MVDTERANERWTFECEADLCNAYREVDTEVEALDACSSHADNTGHFDFTITDPEGEVQYP